MRKYNKVMLIDDSEIDNLVNKHILSKSELANEIQIFSLAQEALDYFANSDEKEQLLHLFSIQPEDNSAKIASVKEIFNSSGASSATQKAIQDYTLKAFETLRNISIDNEKKDILRSFGENLMGRKV